MRSLKDNNDGFIDIIVAGILVLLGMAVIAIVWSIVAFVGVILAVGAVILMIKGHMGAPVYWMMLIGVGLVFLGFIAPNIGFQITLPWGEFVQGLM